MPSHTKRTSIPSRDRPSSIQGDLDLLIEEQEPYLAQDNTARLPKKRSKNATARQAASSPSPERATGDLDPPQEEQPSPPPSQILQQLPRAFPSRPKEPVAKDLTDLGISEKVSDDHTPPHEACLPPNSYGRTPSTDLLPGLAYAGTPPTLPGSIERGGFSTRSPPISPPQVKARPASFGGRPPSHYAASRASPAPYAYPPSAYGSPPNLPPHYPQPHFYNPQDVDLGLASNISAHQRLGPTMIKASTLAVPGRKEESVILMGYQGQLDVLTQHEQGLEHIGSLRNLPGTVKDAVFLSWAHGPDPYRDQRPLIALSLCLPDSYGGAQDIHPANTYTGASRQGYTASVVVFSLKHQTPIMELLKIPEQPASLATCLRMETHGNFLTVGLTVTGEIFILAPALHGDEAVFECLTKAWTSLQPRIQRRDSSHGRPYDSDASPADASQGQSPLEQPIFSLNGRWLAYCPNASEVQSVGATLGERVMATGGNAISSRAPGSRPIVTCGIDSPDAPTLFGRMAKGAAQEILRGANIIRDRGMQYWRDYWNPDGASGTGAAPSSYMTPTNREPINFPPTHAESNTAEPSEPEVVALIDLLGLQGRESGRSGDQLSPIAVFQPPGGCSFLSFMPNGLGLFTASRKGDAQYVWDLFQMRHPRATMLRRDQEAGQLAARVRQIAKYERMSPSVIVDLEWESPLGSRFAVLTQNRTIHMFDLPATALEMATSTKDQKATQRFRCQWRSRLRPLQHRLLPPASLLLPGRLRAEHSPC